MSDVRDPLTDQPAPEKNDRPYIQDLLVGDLVARKHDRDQVGSLVIADIKERKRLGIRKYGTALQAFNGRDMLLDAYEEALDLCIYLKGALEEGDQSVMPMYHKALDLCLNLRAHLKFPDS